MVDDEPRADGGTASDDAAPPDDPAELDLDDEPEPTEPGTLKSDDPEEDTAPEDEGDGPGRADPADAFVPRNADGDVAEVETTVEGYGTAVIRPMVYGDIEEHLGDAGAVAQAGPDSVAAILRNHVVEPDFEAYAREEYGEWLREQSRGDGDGPPPYLCGAVVREQMSPWAPQAYLMAIMRESGMDVDVMVGQTGEATIEFGEDAEGN